MKKQLLIISIIVVIVSVFVSCSVNGRRDGDCSIRYNSTTAVTDNNGTTHYYEPVTDDKDNILTTAKNQGVFAEVESSIDSSSTDADGASPIPTANYVEDADNVVEFEATVDNDIITSEQTTETTTQKETRPATDKDGWITKWY